MYRVFVISLVLLSACSSPMELEGDKNLCAVRTVQTDLSPLEYLRSIELEDVDKLFQGTNCLTIFLLNPDLTSLRVIHLEKDKTGFKEVSP